MPSIVLHITILCTTGKENRSPIKLLQGIDFKMYLNFRDNKK